MKPDSSQHDPNAELRSFEPLRVSLALGALLLGLLLGIHWGDRHVQIPPCFIEFQAVCRGRRSHARRERNRVGRGPGGARSWVATAV